MHLGTTGGLFAALGGILGFGVLIAALVQYRRRPESLIAALVWLGLAITIGSAKQFVASSGTAPWLVLFGIEVACAAIAFWQLGRHVRSTARRGAT